MGVRLVTCNNKCVAIGGFLFDPHLPQLSSADCMPVRFRLQNLAVLRCLASRPDQLVLRQELLDEVWPDRVVTEDSLTQCIAQLRRVLADEQHTLIVTEPLTLRLPAELAEKLDQSAKRLRRNRSDLVRLAIEQFLNVSPNGKPIDRVRDLLGSVNSGIPDLGQNHREYLIERVKRAR